MKKTGFVFPGQGSQTVGMLADLACNFPLVGETFTEASDTLGYDLWKLTQEGPAEELDKTAKTQPAMLAAAYAIWRILKTESTIHPLVMAGHSLGEYTALVCAAAIPFAEAVKLVAARGTFMQEAVPVGQGALAAIIGLEDEVVKEVCMLAAEGEILAPANFNCPGQVVIAGTQTAISRALIIAKEKGAKLAKQLPVSVPSHSALMKPAANRLAAFLATVPFTKPATSVINNVDVAIYKNEVEIRDGLVRQLYMPVRWVETVQSMANLGLERIIECGPGKVLTGLNKRIAVNLEHMNVADVTNITALINEK